MDRIVKFAVDARAGNQNTVKDNYMTPNLHNLIDLIAEKLTTPDGTAWFTALDI